MGMDDKEREQLVQAVSEVHQALEKLNVLLPRLEQLITVHISSIDEPTIATQPRVLRTRCGAVSVGSDSSTAQEEGSTEEERIIVEDQLSSSTTQNQMNPTVQDRIQAVFDYWNQFKGQSKDPKHKWQSHIKLSPILSKTIDMALVEAQGHDEEPEVEICCAIDNYAKALLSADTYWTYVWSLQTFLSVTESHGRGATIRKWWQFLNSNFVEENYRSDGVRPPAEYDKAVYSAIVHRYGRYTNNPGYIPNPDASAKLANASVAVQRACKRWNLKLSECLDYVFDLVDHEWGSKGQHVYPGHLCSQTLWDVQFPQYLKNLGIYS